MTLHWASDKFVRRACSCIVFFSSFWSNLPPPDLSAFMGPPACATLHRSFSHFRENDTLRHPSFHPSFPLFRGRGLPAPAPVHPRIRPPRPSSFYPSSVAVAADKAKRGNGLTAPPVSAWRAIHHGEKRSFLSRGPMKGERLLCRVNLRRWVSHLPSPSTYHVFTERSFPRSKVCEL